MSNVGGEKKHDIWLKFEGSSKERVPNDTIYLERKKERYSCVNRTFYPKNKRPKGVKKGDTLFIAVISEDSNGNNTPLIVGYGTANGFDSKNVITVNDKEYRKQHEKYPHFIEYSEAKFLKASIVNGISLRELCDVLSYQVYPGTLDKPSIGERIYSWHTSCSHIRITEIAGKYLKGELDKLFKRYGYEEVE